MRDRNECENHMCIGIYFGLYNVRALRRIYELFYHQIYFHEITLFHLASRMIYMSLFIWCLCIAAHFSSSSSSSLSLDLCSSSFIASILFYCSFLMSLSNFAVAIQISNDFSVAYKIFSVSNKLNQIFHIIDA